MEDDANEIQKQIEQRISELPPDVQKAIFASDFNEKIQSIGAANQLHLDQTQELADNTMLLMIGFMAEQDFRNEMMQMTGSNTAAVQKITSDVTNQILLPIRESMKKFVAGEATPAEAASLSTSASASSPTRQPLSEVLPRGAVAASMPKTAVSPMKSSPIPAPVVLQVSPAVPAAPTAPLPVVQKAEDMHPADIALTQKTVSLPTPAAPAPAPAAPATPTKAADASAMPPKPTDYKADPYREPIS